MRAVFVYMCIKHIFLLQEFVTPLRMLEAYAILTVVQLKILLWSMIDGVRVIIVRMVATLLVMTGITQVSNSVFTILSCIHSSKIINVCSDISGPSLCMYINLCMGTIYINTLAISFEDQSIYALMVYYNMHLSTY